MTSKSASYCLRYPAFEVLALTLMNWHLLTVGWRPFCKMWKFISMNFSCFMQLWFSCKKCWRLSRPWRSGLLSSVWCSITWLWSNYFFGIFFGVQKKRTKDCKLKIWKNSKSITGLSKKSFHFSSLKTSIFYVFFEWW